MAFARRIFNMAKEKAKKVVQPAAKPKSTVAAVTRIECWNCTAAFDVVEASPKPYVCPACEAVQK